MRAGMTVAGLALALGACSSSPATQTEPSHSPQSPFTYALTGIPADPGTPERAVFVVKVDDTAAGRPQQGVKQADLVIQEPVEGGLTRLAAFFQSTSPESVGPVRSVRASDIGLIQPVRGTVVTSGGAINVLEKFEKAGIPITTEGDPGFIRNPERVMPYNLYADLNEIRRENPDAKLPKQAYLQFGEFEARKGASTKRVRVTFSGTVSNDWVYDPADKTWQRQESDGAVGYQADNLIVLDVKLVDAGYNDSAGNPVPEVVTSGEGTGVLLHGNRITELRWSKKSDTDPFVFSTNAGLVLSVPPGTSWISLIPKQNGDVSFS